MSMHFKTEDKEPTQANFALPSEGEHLLQVVEIMYEMSTDAYATVKLEIAEVDSDELGVSMLHRVSFNQEWNGFFMTQLFLKAIGEPYKGEFDIDTNNWAGKRFYATIKHNEGKNGRTYANIDKFNFDKKVPELPEINESELDSLM